MSALPRLGEILVRYYRVPETTVEGAASALSAVPGRLGDVLLTLGAVTEDDLARAVAFQRRIPVALNLQNAIIDPAVLRLVPAVIAAWDRVLPISRTKREDGRNDLLVAMGDPGDVELCRELEQLTKCVVQPAVAVESDLRAAISRFYTGAASLTLDEEHSVVPLTPSNPGAVLPMMSPSEAPTES